jgi:hypothetical protein
MSTTIKGPVLVVEDDANIASLVATYTSPGGL